MYAVVVSFSFFNNLIIGKLQSKLQLRIKETRTALKTNYKAVKGLFCSHFEGKKIDFDVAFFVMSAS